MFLNAIVIILFSDVYFYLANKINQLILFAK
ncbi:hypothetical protein ABIC45_003531 [Mucilaginibacter rubeus]